MASTSKVSYHRLPGETSTDLDAGEEQGFITSLRSPRYSSRWHKQRPVWTVVCLLSVFINIVFVAIMISGIQMGHPGQWNYPTTQGRLYCECSRNGDPNITHN